MTEAEKRAQQLERAREWLKRYYEQRRAKAEQPEEEAAE